MKLSQQLRVIDLEAVAVHRDLEVFGGDAVHFNASSWLVMADDVDRAADQADLELAHQFDIDNLGLPGGDQPFFQ